MSTIQDTDTLLVNRGGTDYKVKAEDVRDYLKDYQVVLVTPPVIDPPYVVVGSKAYAKAAEYKLEVVTREAPVYEYAWAYEYNGGIEYQDGSWRTYSGTAEDLTYNYRNGVEKYYLKCRYTYKGITEEIESNRAPSRPKPSYIVLKDYFAEKLPTVRDAFWAGNLGDWVYCGIRCNSPDEAKGGMYRFKRSTFDYDANVDQLEKVFDWPDPSIDSYGGYMVFDENYWLKNKDFNYWVSVDAGKTWKEQGEIIENGQRMRMHNVISQLSSNTFRTLLDGSGQTERFSQQADLTFNADSTVTVTNASDVPGQWGYFWTYNAMDWKGVTQCVPDSNGYFFGASQDWSTFNRWTDTDWNPATVPETMACPSFKDQPANTYVAFPSLCLWDEVTQSYVLQVEFKENGTNDLKGDGVYHFKWGDSEADLHPANTAIGAKTRYDQWSKVIVRGKALGWQVYKSTSSYFRYDVGGDYKIKLKCDKPNAVFMGCNLNNFTNTSSVHYIFTGDDCK